MELETMRAVLRGKKTYLAAAVGVLYLAGCWAGAWELDDRVLVGVGLGSLGGMVWLRRLLGGGGKGPPGGGAALVVLCAGLAAGAGCVSNAPGRALATAAVAVDGGMRGWGAYVAAGRATAAEEARVRAAYERYQAAELAAERAYVAAARLEEPGLWSAAAAGLTAARGELLGLIEGVTAGGGR